MNTTLVIKPIASEKSYVQSSRSVYVFEVPTDSNKLQIAVAVAKTYDVKVTDVRTATVKGKKKRLYRNRRFTEGSRKTIKKAYVTLVQGQTIPIFESLTDKPAENVSVKKPKKGKE